MNPKRLGLAALAAMALMAFLGASSAAATELFAKGETLEAGTTIHGTLTAGTSTLSTTDGKTLVDTCTGSTIDGTTSNAEGEFVNISIGSLTWSGCSVTTDTLTNGSLSISWTEGLNGTLTGAGSVVTANFAGVSCRYGTGSGTHLGTVTGTMGNEGETGGLMDVNAVINEQEPKHFICPDTTRWQASYGVINPAPFYVQPKEIVDLEQIALPFKEGEWQDLEVKNTGNVTWIWEDEEFVTGKHKLGAWGAVLSEFCNPTELEPRDKCKVKRKCVNPGEQTWIFKVKSLNKGVKAQRTTLLECT
jgi:hypothetical protein